MSPTEGLVSVWMIVTVVVLLVGEGWPLLTAPKVMISVWSGPISPLSRPVTVIVVLVWPRGMTTEPPLVTACPLASVTL